MPTKPDETQNLLTASPKPKGKAASPQGARTASNEQAEAANGPAAVGTPDTPGNGSRRTSERKIAANRANSQKSTGPRTEQGIKRASMNALKRRSVRLLGLAEARTLRQEPGAAEKLYRELIAPYEPAPALLAAHFEDFARLRLELEAWERIRDARLEARWQQSDIERRRAYYEIGRDLPGKAEDVLERGVCGLEDSPAKFRKAAECLDLLKLRLAERNFDVEPILRVLYGQKLELASDRAQTICIRCRKGAKGAAPLTPDEFDELTELVDQEQRDALTAYGLHLDEKTVTRSGRLSRLCSTLEDLWMNLQGERLRQAIDRKQWVITGLLQTLYGSGESGAQNASGHPEQHPLPPPPSSSKTKPKSPLESTKRFEKRPKTKPNEAKRSQNRRRHP